ncbi:MAG: mitochondrial 54S ribosomal protein L40, partial [Maritimibacter sp.]
GLMARCDDAGKLRPMSELQSGDEVELLTGPFADFIATVDSIDANRRVWVLMEMMGQTTRLSLDPDQLRLRA